MNSGKYNPALSTWTYIVLLKENNWRKYGPFKFEKEAIPLPKTLKPREK